MRKKYQIASFRSFLQFSGEKEYSTTHTQKGYMMLGKEAEIGTQDGQELRSLCYKSGSKSFPFIFSCLKWNQEYLLQWVVIGISGMWKNMGNIRDSKNALVLSETSGPIDLGPVTALQRICGFYKATVMSLGQPNKPFQKILSLF